MHIKPVKCVGCKPFDEDFRKVFNCWNIPGA